VVASGSADRRVLLFNPFSCRSLGVLEGHAAPVVCLASNERDMQLISAAADNTIKVRQGKVCRVPADLSLVHGCSEALTTASKHV
jgi:WD40 repeat protein